MDSTLVGSFSKASLGGNVWRRDNLHKNCFSGSYVAAKVSRCRAWDILESYCGVGFQQHIFQQNTTDTKEKSTFYRRHDKKFLVNATAGHPLESEPEAYNPKSIWNSIKNAIDAFYRFSRPHTVIGIALSIISVSLLAVKNLSDLSPLFFTGVLEAVVAALFMNIYIVGLNQLSDIDIDKVALSSVGIWEYSVGTGIMIVTSFLIMSFLLGWVVGSWPLFWALFISFVLGTAYSINLPLLRWKRSAVVAAMCILAVRAVIVQLAFFLHMQDIPDIDGEKRVFWICILLLEMAYSVAVLVEASSGFMLSKCVTVLGHTILAVVLWNRAKSVDLNSKAAITSFYMFVWKLFYAEYLLIPLVR
ncbi:homogentisate phytyltransferase 1 [Pyrus ussuriensis x Pyrus communis]|uniref:Homogentisate phytyltransferase 1 n=1 Tax=Pyrus ussuriensis x Pyrus communis TaxID=2448454 RepID=A0A5N5FT86_9ROSA|nr:homogentisate phytyltransferase 1 [Pyrus ussuriensis x Pyrus communis]